MSEHLNPLTEDRVRLLINESLSTALTAHEAKMMGHLDSGFDRLSQTFASAFPGGDPHGHRLAHEKAIRAATGWDRLKSDVMSKVLTAGLWAAAGFLAFAVWEAIRSSIRSNTP
jgi:hypothetical protein